VSSDNLIGADNQQERLDIHPQDWVSRILRDHMPNIATGDEDMVRSAWRHAESGRNDLTPLQESLLNGGNNNVGPYPV
jgi:hypothetical protein